MKVKLTELDHFVLTFKDQSNYAMPGTVHYPQKIKLKFQNSQIGQDAQLKSLLFFFFSCERV